MDLICISVCCVPWTNHTTFVVVVAYLILSCGIVSDDNATTLRHGIARNVYTVEHECELANVVERQGLSGVVDRSRSDHERDDCAWCVGMEMSVHHLHAFYTSINLIRTCAMLLCIFSDRPAKPVDDVEQHLLNSFT